jgi:signal transduction histidine kinase
MDRHHIAWHVSLPEADPLLLLDRNHFQQAILNVMRNAIEAMADGGMLIVAMERKDNAYEIRITDTGLGIAKGHIKKVDEPFFTTKTHSMGLGLSLAKRTVEMHNGQLHITKNRIGGTTTIFLLPDNIPS